MPDINVVQDDSAIVTRIREGDVQAFEELYLRFHDGLSVFAYRYTEDQDQAADLVSDVFFNLWAARREWSLRGSLKSYLFTATRNQALNYVRSRKRELARHIYVSGYEEGKEDRINESEAHSLDEDERDAILWDVVDQLHERARTVITLRWKEKMKLVEIATVLGVSAGAVEKIHKRALESLSKRLTSLVD